MARAWPAGRPTVLLVEDDPEVMDVLRQGLQDGGYAVASCSTRSAAAHHLLTQQVDLLITDLVLGDGDGAVLMRLARRHRIPVLGITGHPTRRLQMAGCPDALPGEVLLKPFTSERLTAEAGRLLAGGY